MKCVRETGLGEHWSILDRRCREYSRKFGKKRSLFTRRCRTGAKLLHKMDITTHKHGTRQIYWSVRARINYSKLLKNKPNVKWQ